MNSNENIEENLIRMSEDELISYMFENNFIQRTKVCEGTCGTSLQLKKCIDSCDNFVWRCENKNCSLTRKRFSIRYDSFFDNLNVGFLKILKILLRIACNQRRSSILQSIDVSKPLLTKIYNKLIDLMILDNENNRMLGGANTIIQIDETMLNYKCKSHRGRSPTNKTDALCIVECSPNITQIWSQTIPDKKATTLIPIICKHVIPNSIIYTDEHKSYNSLQSINFSHNTVCHKYNFINPINGVHTQHVESLNNCLKYEIKLRKGIDTEKRDRFLSDFTWKWNNKNNLLYNLFNLIKI